jgi:membrane protease YdiL (CAAX protease family)
MKKTIKNKIVDVAIVAFLVLTVLFEFVKIDFCANDLHNGFLQKILGLVFGTVAVYAVMLRINVKLFSKPEKILFFLPCLVVAVNNFQFYSYFSGNMTLVHNGFWDFFLFAIYCIAVGLFEEGVFRGVITPLIASFFPSNKKGLWCTFILSSVVFGCVHLFNLFSGAGFVGTILQVGYSILTGGLFTFVLFKTKNIFLCAFTHAIYNFGGQLFSPQGLGAGVVFDATTAWCMAIVGVIVGVFVLISVAKYSSEEQAKLYEKFGITAKKQAENV